MTDDFPLSLRIAFDRAGLSQNSPLANQLREWFDFCDVKSGLQAIGSARRLSDNSSNDLGAREILGIVLARSPEVQVVGTSGILLRSAHKFSNSEKEAIRILRSVGKGSSWDEAVYEIARLSLWTRSPAALEAAREMLVSASSKPNSSEQVASLQSEVSIALGDLSGGVAAFRSGRPNTAEGMRQYGIALMLLRPKSPSGAAFYLEGLQAADSVSVERYFEDLSLLLTREEMLSWSNAPVAERARWIRVAWEWRATISAQSIEERLSQHFARLVYAFDHFRRNSFRGARPVTALWLDPNLQLQPLDDRGLTFVRHGAPDEVVGIALAGDAREGWYYRSLAGGRALLEFNNVSKEGRQIIRWGDHFMTEPFRCEGGFAQMPHEQRLVQPKVLPSELRGQLAKEVYVSRINALDPSLHADDCSNTLAGDSGRFVLRSPNGELRRVVSDAVMQTETAVRTTTKPLSVMLASYAFRRDDRTLIGVLGWVSGKDVTPLAEPGTYSLRVFTALETASTRSISRNDTIVLLTRELPLPDNSVLRFPSILYSTTQSNSTIRFSVRNVADSLQGQVVSLNRGIPSFDKSKLEVSDIIVGEPRSGTWLPLSDAPIPLPGHQVAVHSQFRLYYEVYGPGNDQPMDVSIRIVRAPSRSTLGKLADLIREHNAATISFQEIQTRRGDASVAVVRDIVAELNPGTYVVEITTSSPDKSVSVSRRTELTVVGK
jgi:hypothetical protein